MQHIRRSWTVTLAILGLVFATGRIAHSATILFEYTGTIQHVAFFNGASDALGFVAGETVSGSFTFDHNSPDLNADPDDTFYPFGVRSMTFGGLTAAATDYSLFQVSARYDLISSYLNSAHDSISDVYEFMLSAAGGTDVIQHTDMDLSTLDLAAFDRWDNSRFSFQRAASVPGVPAPKVVQVAAAFTSLAVTTLPDPVPEPSTWVLLGTGLVGLLGSGWRRRRLE